MKRFLLILSALGFSSYLAQAAPLAVGAPAPAISAVDQDGKTINFADVYAKGLTLVYFYPKAGTSGCTKQACSLRDSYADLTARGIQVIGVSRDSSGAQKTFQEKYKLPFTLIADVDGSVAKAFGVDMIPIVNLTQRESFIVKDGRIAWVNTKAKTEGHAAEVRAAVESLK